MSISRLGAAVALSLLFASPLAAQGTKVGYVNTAAVLGGYGPAQEASRQLEAAVLGFQAEFNQLETELNQALGEFQQQVMSMTPEARQLREQQLQAQRAALEERGRELEDLAEQRRAELFDPINTAMQAVLEEIRVEGNYGLILDANLGIIMVADPALDVTQQVLSGLQARSGSEGGT